MSIDLKALIGDWVLDSACEEPHEIGQFYLRFKEDGILQHGNQNEHRIYVLPFKYWIEEDSIATICPPNPRTELSPCSLSDAGLSLFFGNRKTVWKRTQRQCFFDSETIWDPGILFERQIDYMSMANDLPSAFEIEQGRIRGLKPQILVNTIALLYCWKYSHGPFASFHLDDFNQLLERGVYLNDIDNEDRALLSYLAEDGLTEAVKAAVEFGADINHLDLYGNTALDYAVWKGRGETAQLMRELGGIAGK